MDWWNVEEFPTAHTTASHDVHPSPLPLNIKTALTRYASPQAFVISRREGLTHITFPAGYAAAVVEAQKHQGDPSYRFPALTVKMDRSRWYRFFEAEEWFIKDGDLEGWKQVLDDRRAFVKLLLRLFHYILAGKASVPGMQDSFAEAV